MSNISETDSHSSAGGGGGGVGGRKRSRKDTSSGKSSSQHECRRLSDRIAHALRKPRNASDNETVVSL